MILVITRSAKVYSVIMKPEKRLELVLHLESVRGVNCVVPGLEKGDLCICADNGIHFFSLSVVEHEVENL